MESVQIGVDDMIVEPDVRDVHLILRQRSRLVRTDDRRGAERFDRLQVFDETVLAGHPLGRQGQDKPARKDDDDGTLESDAGRELTVTVASRPSGTWATMTLMRKTTASTYV